MGMEIFFVTLTQVVHIADMNMSIMTRMTQISQNDCDPSFIF